MLILVQQLKQQAPATLSVTCQDSQLSLRQQRVLFEG
jgi:hypothetical protein